MVICSEEYTVRRFGEIEPSEALKILREKLCPRADVLGVTLGGKGSLTYDFVASRSIKTDVFPVNVQDPTGAGDAYHAGLIRGLILGWGVSRASAFGAAAASLAIETIGFPGSFDEQECLRRMKVIQESQVVLPLSCSDAGLET